MCAPPLLLIVTSGETCADEDVAPDVVVVSVTVVPLPVVVDAVLVDVESPVVDKAGDPVDDSPLDVVLDVESAEFDDKDDSDDVPVVSAAATPYPVATAVTSHATTAMPPYPPRFAALCDAFLGGEAFVGEFDEGAENNGLARGLLTVMGAPMPKGLMPC